jgi:hypothetical protein
MGTRDDKKELEPENIKCHQTGSGPTAMITQWLSPIEL